MNKIKSIMRFALPAIMAGGFIIGTASGAAASAPGTAVVTGTATTSPLKFPPAAATGATWALSTLAVDCTGTPGTCGAVSLSGSLGAVAGVGPSCGVSSGTGSGSIFGHNVTVSWASSVGSAFPVMVVSGAHTFQVLVQISPTDPTACATTGATAFNVRAEVTVV